MGAYTVSCSQDRQNVLVDKCEGFGTLAGIILAPVNDFIDTEVNARLLDTWVEKQQADKSGRIYIINNLHAFNDVSEDAVLADGITGKVFVKAGADGYELTFAASPYRAKTLKAQEGKRSLYLFDTQGRIRAVRGTSDEFKAIPVNVIVGNRKENNGTDPGRIIMTIAFEQTELMHKNPAILSDLDFKPQDFLGLKDVELTVSAPLTTGATVTAKELYSGDAAFGIGATDFLIKNQSGVVQTYTATDNEDGTYTLVWTLTAGTYTASLKAPKDMATTGYEVVAPVTFTISA